MASSKKIPPSKWADILRRFIVEGESASALAREIGVTEGAIRKRAGTKRYEVKDLANQIVTSQKKYDSYDDSTKVLVDDMVSQLRAISNNIARAAISSSATSARLSKIAEAQTLKIDEDNPMETAEELQAISALTKMANDAAIIPMNLINSSKRDKASDSSANIESAIERLIDRLPN